MKYPLLYGKLCFTEGRLMYGIRLSDIAKMLAQDVTVPLQTRRTFYMLLRAAVLTAQEQKELQAFKKELKELNKHDK